MEHLLVDQPFVRGYVVYFLLENVSISSWGIFFNLFLPKYKMILVYKTDENYLENENMTNSGKFFFLKPHCFIKKIL